MKNTAAAKAIVKLAARFARPFAFALPALFLAACAEKGATLLEEAPEVKTFVAERTKQTVTIETFGSVTYSKKNDVSALVEGTIVEQKVQEGSEVKKGQELFRLKNVQYEIQRAECRNRLHSAGAKVRAARNALLEQERSAEQALMALENARLNLAQKKEERSLQLKNLEKNVLLFEAGGISESALEQLKIEAQAAQTEIEVMEKEIAMQSLGFRDEDLRAAGILPSQDDGERRGQFIALNSKGAKIQIELAEVEERNAERDLEAIDSLMENLVVRAPCRGTVGAIYVESGERAKQNDTLLTIIDMDVPFAKAAIQEKDMEKIRVGSAAVVEIQAAALRQKSQVEFISPLADAETGNFFIKIPVENGGQKARVGMFAKCFVETNDSKSLFVLPQSALFRRDGNTALFYCVENGVVFAKACPIEMEKNGALYIENGLNGGECVVENPSPSLKEGARVKAI